MNRENKSSENISEEIVYGRNAVTEAIKSGMPINKVLISSGDISGSLKAIMALVKEKHLVYQFVEKNKLNDITGTKNHQGVALYTSPAEYCEVDDILQKAKDANEAPFVIILDEIQDPHNFGAIIRTADAVGAHGIIIPKRRSVQLTGTVAKTSAGASAHVPIARVSNIPATIDQLKEAGLWIAGTDLTGTVPFYKADFKGPIGIVIGSEGHGMGNLVTKKCDFIVTIPMKGEVSSLNASVAAGVVLYEVFKGRLVE
ncbi:MAG: 23S rRNA (guanosine(2251)-2'-O)-methyltransferase RlmB [Ruminococcaceae bacterium]|nr:23S rRNA (guanosine(2251)-2'-O)-methyltransferase RlmB [Oscillospiraceae bacterium]